MKTPYDTALRALGREVDELRSAIGAAAGRLAEVETRHQAVSDAMASESQLAARDWTFSPAPYMARARAERERLGEARQTADAELATLRRQAADSYGSLRAMEGAAEGFRADAGRTAAAAEQAGADDIAGARFARALHVARHARGQARHAR